MSVNPAKAIKNVDFVFENMPVKIIANRDNVAINLPGMKVGPFKEGKEYEVRYWIAMELKKVGIARILLEEPLDLMMLNKIHWKERVQTSQKVTSLPKEFYPKLRRFLKRLHEEAIKKPEKRIDLEKANNLSLDIIRMRLKKIVSLASSGRDQTAQILGSLTKEEKCIYDLLHKFISEWQNEILKIEK